MIMEILRRVWFPAGCKSCRTVLGMLLFQVQTMPFKRPLLSWRGSLSRNKSTYIFLLHPGDCYVDVGTNLGLLTLLQAGHWMDKEKLICFEPFPQTCSLLRHTLFINGLAEWPLHTVPPVLTIREHAFTYRRDMRASFPLWPGVPPIPEKTTEVTMSSSGWGVGRYCWFRSRSMLKALNLISSVVLPVLENTAGLVVEFGISHLKRTAIPRMNFWICLPDWALSGVPIQIMVLLLRQADLEAVSSINLFLRVRSFMGEGKRDSHEWKRNVLLFLEQVTCQSLHRNFSWHGHTVGLLHRGWRRVRKCLDILLIVGDIQIHRLYAGVS